MNGLIVFLVIFVVVQSAHILYLRFVIKVKDKKLQKIMSMFTRIKEVIALDSK